MPAPALTNVRIVTLLAASMLAGYAGDELLNAWWRPAQSAPSATNLATKASADKPIAN